MSHKKFEECIRACLACAIACNHCASECLGEEEVKHLAKCIRLDLECAAICRAAGELMSLGSSYSVDLCRLCAQRLYTFSRFEYVINYERLCISVENSKLL